MTRVLVCGAGGLIGAALARRLQAAGMTVVRGVRRARAPDELGIDYCRDTTVASWVPRLAGIDIVVNAVGIIVERPGQRFVDVHDRAPRALFAACAAGGVRRVVQISALGADRGQTPYFRSKRAADTALMESTLAWQIVRPALVYAVDGASATMFRMLASLPVVPLPGGGRQCLQPIHIDDLVDIVVALIDPAQPAGQCRELAGPEALTVRQMLATYRASLGFAPAPEVPVPAPVMALSARLATIIPGSVLTPDTWRMLQAGNVADPSATRQILGHPARGPAHFIDAPAAAALRQRALAQWRTPLLRAALAVVWVGAALVTAFLYPVDASLALVNRLGLTGGAATGALTAGIAVDLAMGAATLLLPGRRIWTLQIVTILAYTGLVAVALPEFLVHPFGPVLKNVPLLALLFVLLAEEQNP